MRHALPARHLEPVLQALVREGILKGIRGPRGGYELARERRRITADDILRAAGTIEDDGGRCRLGLLNEVVRPAVAQAEQAFSAALSRINVEDLVRTRRAVPRRQDLTGRRSRVAACNTSAHIAHVHGLDSYGAIPVGVKSR